MKIFQLECVQRVTHQEQEIDMQASHAYADLLKWKRITNKVQMLNVMLQSCTTQNHFVSSVQNIKSITQTTVFTAETSKLQNLNLVAILGQRTMT